MDIDDDYVLSGKIKPRLMKCSCKSIPTAPKVDYGCQCPSCKSKCKKCPGFGYSTPPLKRVHQILSRVRSQIKRSDRSKGHPPGFIRLSIIEIRLLLRKHHNEDNDHWIRDIVEPGPPVKIYGVIVVEDRRRE
jgi:hypothetical protein